jgi:hypothetical protein
MRSVIVALAGLLLVGVAATEAVSPQAQIKALEERVATLENALAELTNRVTTLEDSLPGNEASAPPHIVDSAGRVVGVVLDQATVFDGAANASEKRTVLLDAAVMMQIEGISTIVRVTLDAITGFLSPEATDTAPLNFDGADCTGNPYITAIPTTTFGGRALLFGSNLYIPKPEPGVLGTMASHVRQANDGTLFCDTPQPGSLTNTYVEAMAVPLSVFDGFTPPFSLVGLPQLP